MKSYNVTIHDKMKAIEQYFPVVLFIILYKVVLTFEYVNEILKCNHSKEIQRAFTFLRYCLLRYTRWF